MHFVVFHVKLPESGRIYKYILSAQQLQVFIKTNPRVCFDAGHINLNIRTQRASLSLSTHRNWRELGRIPVFS